MVLNVDLNVLPAESRQFESDAAPIDLEHEHITFHGSPGSFTSPIDADAVDDDVMLLPSTAWFSAAKRQSRRKRPVTVLIDESLETNTWRPVTVLIDESLETNTWRSGVVDEPVTTLSLSTQKMHTQVPFRRMIIDCDFNANENCIPKMNEGMKANPNTWKEASAPPKEPTLTCPVCLSTLNEPSTTVCGHVFCRSCIETAISKQKKCPTCRRKLSKRNFHRIYLP